MNWFRITRRADWRSLAGVTSLMLILWGEGPYSILMATTTADRAGDYRTIRSCGRLSSASSPKTSLTGSTARGRIYEPLGAKITGNPATITWPSGAIFRLGHLNDANAYGNYVGHEYQRMLIEELNLIPTEANYLKLISSCRSTVPGLRPQVMSNFNPSDARFAWIKQRFGLLGTTKPPVETTDSKTGLKRIFIPSDIKDNPYLDADPQYHAFLNSLPDGLREAWRDGSWGGPVSSSHNFEIGSLSTKCRLRMATT
jgi:hypothetical protein